MFVNREKYIRLNLSGDMYNLINITDVMFEIIQQYTSFVRRFYYEHGKKD